MPSFISLKFSNLPKSYFKKNSFDKKRLSQHIDYLSLNEQQQEDLILFRILSLQVDEQNHFWNQRTDDLLYLSLKTAELSDRNLDKVQLVAAIYMHDTGMAFVPDNIVNKNNKLNAMETKKLQNVRNTKHEEISEHLENQKLSLGPMRSTEVRNYRQQRRIAQEQATHHRNENENETSNQNGE